MDNTINIKIDGIECQGQKGQYIIEVAKANKIYIPSLCNMPGVKPRGGCRICTIHVNGRKMTACTTPIAEGMEIESTSPELQDLRISIVELLFVEGNHFCPSCERSGNCELQALGYRFKMLAPRFPYQFPERNIDASHPELIKDHNRCILCKRCVRAFKDEKGRSFFAFKRRGHEVLINVDAKLSEKMTGEMAQEAMDICPVGALIKKEKGFITPIGERKYDRKPIGTDVEEQDIAIV
ncbi:2Fe-2S iron-sulfur cluster-binding protein [Bacteroidota bacterium]